jgi:hypothetical protein
LAEDKLQVVGDLSVSLSYFIEANADYRYVTSDPALVHAGLISDLQSGRLDIANLSKAVVDSIQSSGPSTAVGALGALSQVCVPFAVKALAN